MICKLTSESENLLQDFTPLIFLKYIDSGFWFVLDIKKKITRLKECVLICLQIYYLN